MRNRPKFAVLGAGHGGRAMAAYLAAIGCDVNLYNRTPENIQNIKQAKGILLTFTADLKDYLFPMGTGVAEIGQKYEYSLSPETDKLIEEDLRYVFGKIKTISSDMKAVMKDRDVIMVVVPASGHRYMAEKCAPYLRDGQIILLNPGRCFGAIEFYRIVNDYYKGEDAPDITIGEAQTFIYACRRTRPLNVRVLAVKESVDVASIPSKKITNVLNSVKDFYPQFTPTENVLKTSLGNLSGVFHVPITILNATRIDRKRNFRYYLEGITKHTASIIEDVDKERLAIAEAMGVEAISARKWLHQTYGSEGTDLYEAIQNTHAYRKIESPKSINHRYIWEDVPTALVPLSSLGKKSDVPTPLIDSFIRLVTSIFKKIFDIDFFERGRTMEKMGLDRMSIDEIKNFVETGYEN
jgi:opine dehydrogenase